jgi:hypothetical protein
LRLTPQPKADRGSSGALHQTAARCTLAKRDREFALTETHPFGTVSFLNEWKFLCACTSPVDSREKIEQRISESLDWKVVLDLGLEHGVLGLIAEAMKERDYEGVPTGAREKLQTRMRAQHLFTLSMTADLFRILEDFSKGDIETLLVKGPLVSLLAYGDPAVRSFVDLDLLVRDRDILAATRRMVGMGFESDVPESAINAGKIPGEYLFYWPDTKRLIELHTERTFRYYPLPMRIEDLYQGQRRVLLDGRELPGLSLEDEFVLNCIHGAKHFWERLIWVADISALVARHPELDWEKARRAARDVGAVRMLYLALQLGVSLLDLKLPAEIAKEVAGSTQTQKLAKQVDQWLPLAGYAPPALRARAMFRVQMAGGGLPGLGYLLRLSLSPTEEDWVEGAEAHRSWLWDAISRPYRLLRKYGQGG